MLETYRETFPDCDVVIYRFDPEESVLRPTVGTPRLVSQIDELPPLDTDSTVWEAFVKQRPVTTETFTDFELGSAEGLSTAEAIACPVSTYGVILFLIEENTDEIRNAARLFAEAIELAYERSIYKSISDRYAGDDRTALEESYGVQTVLAIHQAGIESGTRRELAEEICAIMTDVSGISMATMTSRAELETASPDYTVSGEPRAYLDGLFRHLEDSAEPTFLAASTREPVIVDRVEQAVETEPWRGRALEHGIASVIALPIAVQSTFFGVLTLYFSDPLDGNSSSSHWVTKIGPLVADGIASLYRKSNLLSKYGTAIEISITDESCLNLALARAAEAELIFESIEPTAEGQVAVIVRVVEGSHQSVLDLPERSVFVEDVTHLRETATGSVFELSLSKYPLEIDLLHLGLIPVEVRADQTLVTARAMLAPDQEVRTVLDTLAETYPSIELNSVTDGRPDEMTEQPETLLSTLSERQREVLAEAVRSGYFESPRRADGNEIASTLDMAPSTFYDHIRAAQRNLFEAVFEDRW